MSGVPTNDPLGGLLGGLLGGQPSQRFALAQMQQQAASQNFVQAMVNATTATSAGGVQYIPYAVPGPPSMTGTEFIKASLRVAMEREMRLLYMHLIWILAPMIMIAVLLGIAIAKHTGILQLGFLFGLPAYGGAFVVAYFIRRQVREWIERHLS